MALPDRDEQLDTECMKEALEILSRRFEAAQLFASRHESTEEGTVRAAKGFGNWFARYGQIHNWLITADELEKIEIRKNEE